MNTYTKAEVDAIIFTTNSNAFSKISIINLELETSYLTNIQIADASHNKSEVYAKTDNIFEVQKIRAMSADFPNIADAVFFYDGIMESHFEFIAPNITKQRLIIC